MRGVKYLFDEKGRKSAVLIDLKTNRAMWEDLIDQVIASARAKEPRETLASVRRRLKRSGKLSRPS